MTRLAKILPSSSVRYVRINSTYRMSLSADALKYVVDMSESRMPRASAWPAAKGSVCIGQSKLCS